MADYPYVQSGQPVELKSDWVNGWQDAARGYAAQPSGGSTSNGGKSLDTSCTRIRVQNVSGSTIPAFQIATLKEPVFLPGTDINATDSATNDFRSRAMFTVEKPISADAGSWCVLQQPLEDKAMGWAVVSGVTPCWINVVAAADKSVDVDPGQTIPKSGGAGQQIVWVKGGVTTATSTGAQWAVILLGGGGAAALPTGLYQYQLYGMVSQNQSGWTYVLAHSIPT